MFPEGWLTQHPGRQTSNILIRIFIRWGIPQRSISDRVQCRSQFLSIYDP